MMRGKRDTDDVYVAVDHGGKACTGVVFWAIFLGADYEIQNGLGHFFFLHAGIEIETEKI